MPGYALPPGADERDPARPGADREGGQRDRDLTRRRAPGLQGLRQRGLQEIRVQPTRAGQAIDVSRSWTGPGVGGDQRPGCRLSCRVTTEDRMIAIRVREGTIADRH